MTCSYITNKYLVKTCFILDLRPIGPLLVTQRQNQYFILTQFWIGISRIIYANNCWEIQINKYTNCAKVRLLYSVFFEKP